MNSIVDMVIGDITDFSAYGMFVAICRLFIVIIATETVALIMSYLGDIGRR